MNKIKARLSIKTNSAKKIYLALKPDIGNRKNLREKISYANNSIIYELEGKISHVKAAINTLISLIEMLKQVDEHDIDSR